ncbi:MAG: zf-HC2 domain-containing protein [Candidatus Polarisedimenticolia bacterium]
MTGSAGTLCELLDFHLNGSLSEKEDAAFRDHLASCLACRTSMDELVGLAAAIERHGTDLPASAGFPLRWLAAIAAAVLVGVALLVSWDMQAGREGVPREVHLALGDGALRGDGAHPLVTIGTGTESVVITYIPPPVSDERNVSVVDRDNRPVHSETPVGPVDVMGRATLTLPASSLAEDGDYALVVRTRTSEGTGRVYSYPFEVRRGEAGS